MAPPSSFLLLVLFLFLHYSLSMSFTTNEASQLINPVCSRAQNHDFCLQTLSSNPDAGKADLKDLDHISLSLTIGAASENDAFTGKLLESVTDPGEKQVLEHCKLNYAGSIYALRQAQTNLDAGQSHEVDVNTQVALQNSNDCDRVIKQGPPPPSLEDKNTKMLQLTDISIAIAGLLANL